MPKKKLLFICRLLPEYNVATGDRYQTEMLEELARDFEIHIAALVANDPAHCDYHRSRYAAGLRIGHLHESIAALKKTERAFDVVLFGKSDVAYVFPIAHRAFPRAVTAVNTVDIQHRRERMVLDIARRYDIPAGDIASFPADPDATRRGELSFYRSVDCVITISGEEKRLLAAEGIPEERIFVCRIAQPLADAAYDPDGPYLTFVGYADHLANYVSVKTFIDTIYPLIKDRLAGSGRRIAVIGRDDRGLYAGLRRDGLVETPGHLDLPEIRTRYYSRACLSLAPLVAGSGVKGKILEAMAHRLPVVTTEVGLQGLEEFRDCVVLIDMDDPPGAARRIIAALGDREGRAALSERAARRLADYNASDENYSALRTRLNVVAGAPLPGGSVRALRRAAQPLWWWFAR